MFIFISLRVRERELPLEFYIFILLTYDCAWQELVARLEGSKLDIVCYLAFSHNFNLLRWMQQAVHLLTLLDPLHQKPQIQSNKIRQRFDLMWTFQTCLLYIILSSVVKLVLAP